MSKPRGSVMLTLRPYGASSLPSAITINIASLRDSLLATGNWQLITAINRQLLLKKAAALEDAVVKVTAQQLDLRAAGPRHHRDDVVAVGFARNIHQPAIAARGAGDLPLLAQVNGAF